MISSLKQIKVACLPSAICHYTKSRLYLATQFYKSTIKEQHLLPTLIILLLKIRKQNTECIKCCDFISKYHPKHFIPKII